MLNKEEDFFGPGPVKLLKAIRETASVRTACKKLNMSYSKGWKIINRIEQAIGRELVVRHKGGQYGGTAYLTEQADQLIDRYERFFREVNRSADRIFEQVFEDFFEE